MLLVTGLGNWIKEFWLRGSNFPSISGGRRIYPVSVSVLQFFNSGTCNNHIGMGVRYNAEKKKIGNYYSTPIFSFRCKCHLCDGWFEIQTDPKVKNQVSHLHDDSFCIRILAMSSFPERGRRTKTGILRRTVDLLYMVRQQLLAYNQCLITCVA